MSKRMSGGFTNWSTKQLQFSQAGKNASLTSYTGSPLVALRYWREQSSQNGWHVLIFVKDHENWDELSLREKLSAKNEFTDFYKDDEIVSFSEYEVFKKWHQGLFFDRCQLLAASFDMLTYQGRFDL